MKRKKLICIRNGKEIKIGSVVKFNDDRCDVYELEPPTPENPKGNIGLESLEEGHASWDCIEDWYIGCRWQ